jgi:flagellin-specific chaperone FliS
VLSYVRLLLDKLYQYMKSLLVLTNTKNAVNATSA